MADVATGPADRRALQERVASARWYHTIELPGGIVTPGEYDLQSALERIPFPASFEGKRCLDVGTRDGFWAFEMERRGAEAVVGIDLDDPAALDWPEPRPRFEPETEEDLEARSRTFKIAHEALGSAVERRSLSVYDLEREVAGEFDFAFIGTLLLHLRDPVGALMAIRRVLRGELLINEAISWPLTFWPLRRRRPTAVLMDKPLPFWWTPNLAGLRRYAEAAGYEILDSGGPYLLRNGPGLERPTIRQALRAGASLHEALVLRRGMPHAWICARPR